MANSWQWDDVRIFLAVSREGNLSAAGRTLGVDHVTVGRRIAALEQQLGAKLLHRTPEGFVNTPAGQAVLEQCETMETAALSMERLVAGRDTRAAGSVRLTVGDALSYQILVPCLAALRKSHGDLQIDVITGIQRLDITRREADLAVRVRTVRPAEPGLVCRKLGDIGFTLYASNSYLTKCPTRRRGEGLRGHDLVRFPGAPSSLGPPFMGESLEGARTSLRSNDQFTQLRAVAEGLGIAELACFFGDNYPEVRRVWPDEQPVLKPVWLICHEDLRRAARIRVVSSAIVEAFERQARILRLGQPRRRGG